MNILKRLNSTPGRLVLSLWLSIAVGTASAGDVKAPDRVLHDILAHAGEAVGTFWNQFRSVTCVEKVTQERLGKNEKVEYARKSSFDYLVLLNVEQGGVSVEESRLQQGKSRNAGKVPLLLTSGVPTLLLVFHPYYQDDFRYQVEGEESEAGYRLVTIGFRHIPGTKSTTALRLRGKDYPLDIQGRAWIDPATGTIHRIMAGIEAPMSEHNLKAMTIEIRYSPHTFASGDSPSWLPSAATIEIETPRQHWRNIHQYSSYKEFTVNTEDKLLRDPAAGRR